MSTLLQLVGMQYKSDTNEIIGYEFSERVKGWKEFLLGLKRKYPLAFNHHYDDTAMEKDVKTYIRAIDLLRQTEEKVSETNEETKQGDTDVETEVA